MSGYLTMLNMDSAPKDGTRILVLRHVYGYDSQKGRQVKRGTQIVECFYDIESDRFVKWCGSKNIFTTDSIDPISWIHCPV